MRTIELLAPARNLECGMAAIDHGADAVYIGAERFGARVAAGNSVEDIEVLCRHAHVYGAKVYVTVNTIIFDDELSSVRQIVERLDSIGVDALLVQDMSIIGMMGSSVSKGSVPSMALHASTQTDNRTAAKVRWLRDLGFRRVVLARELSLEEIRTIHEAVPDVELEVFVHGALCVSYSGVCYASQHCFGRSANRGACAQFCRLKFNLEDADGRVIERGRHLLSLKDMCQIDALEQLMEAGAVSFKIEGRLKDDCYVKNVVAAYSQRLNEIIARHPDRYRRASQGRCTYNFTPNLKKTFNRGFTHYFLNGRQRDIVSFDTPKALGEFVGRVKEIRGNSFTVAGTANFANGDGLCFFREERHNPSSNAPTLVLEGFRVNRVENNRLFPLKMPAQLRPGMALYRNNDQEFERLLSRQSCERKIDVSMTLGVAEGGFSLTMTNMEGEVMARVSADFSHQEAQKPQADNIRAQLSKLGGTPYECRSVEIADSADRFFLPSSLLSTLRRSVVQQALENACQRQPAAPLPKPLPDATAQPFEPWSPQYEKYPYLLNVANREARLFYEHQHAPLIEPAFELQGKRPHRDDSPLLLMQCRHCLRYSLGHCTRNEHGSDNPKNARPQWREPLFLVLPDGQRFRLQFDCNQCQMNIYATR